VRPVKMEYGKSALLDASRGCHEVERMNTASRAPQDDGKLSPSTSGPTPAHALPDGSFRNPWPDSPAPAWRDVLRMLTERRNVPRAPTPPRGSFPTAAPDIVVPRVQNDTLSATWIGHSTVLLQIDGFNVLTDPVFSQRAFPVQWTGPRRVMDPAVALEDLPPIDVIAISHIHYDHLDRPAVRRLARLHPAAKWIVPLGVGRYLGGWGAQHIAELDWWQETSVSLDASTTEEGARRRVTLRITATPARHFSARRLGDRNRSLWSGFAFATDLWRVLYVGDTAYHPEFGEIGARCGPFDLVMNPIGAYEPRWFMKLVHVDPDEAVQAYREIAAAHPDAPLPLMLGLHWGTFRLTEEPMDEPPERTRARWHEQSLPEEKLWIARFGETRTVTGIRR
jgi:N-acyl-phosphatidylethanolamine-hydrolysing phospholipase D